MPSSAYALLAVAITVSLSRNLYYDFSDMPAEANRAC
jgi:hypothetical protein